MSIKYTGQLSGAQDPVLITVPIKNSAAIIVGQAVSWSAGVTPATATSAILGVCTGLVDSKGIQLANTGDALDGTFNASTNTYTAASNNMTVLGVSAQVVIDKSAIWLIDADGSGVFSNLDLFGGFYLATPFNVITDATPNAVKGQFKMVRLNELNNTSAYFVINESVLDGSAQI